MPSSANQAQDANTSASFPVQAYCQGLTPLTPRLEPWMQTLAVAPETLAELVERYDSPVNVHCLEPLDRNSHRIREVAQERGVALGIYFARKANKCAAYVDACNDLGLGLDVASNAELLQAIEHEAKPEGIICTAAIKPLSLIELCVEHDVTIVIDNEDELHRTIHVAEKSEKTALIALRVGHFQHAGETLFTRFGFLPEAIPALAKQLRANPTWHARTRLTGLQFHIDGSDLAQRCSAIGECFRLIQSLRELRHPIEFLDIGGGFPMSYIDSADQWQTFLSEHDRALRGERAPLTYRGMGLGRHSYQQEVMGRLDVYPAYQQCTGAEWFAKLLDNPALPTSDRSIAQECKTLDFELRCEPGRSLLDGCGVTVARVEYCKQHPQGYALIGLGMNRTQYRTAFIDHLIDPLLIPTGASRQDDSPNKARQPASGFLAGAYCHESEVITSRRLDFPHGVAVGDLVLFPNTAGYLMHFMESRSHQFPLAQNLLLTSTDPIRVELQSDAPR